MIQYPIFVVDVLDREMGHLIARGRVPPVVDSSLNGPIGTASRIAPALDAVVSESELLLEVFRFFGVVQMVRREIVEREDVEGPISKWRVALVGARRIRLRVGGGHGW